MWKLSWIEEISFEYQSNKKHENIQKIKLNIFLSRLSNEQTHWLGHESGHNQFILVYYFCRITCWRVPTIAVVTRPQIWRPVTVGEGGVTSRCTTPQTLQVMAAPFKAVNHKRLHKKKIRCYLLFRKKPAVIMSFFFSKPIITSTI